MQVPPIAAELAGQRAVTCRRPCGNTGPVKVCVTDVISAGVEVGDSVGSGEGVGLGLEPKSPPIPNTVEIAARSVSAASLFLQRGLTTTLLVLL